MSRRRRGFRRRKPFEALAENRDAQPVQPTSQPTPTPNRVRDAWRAMSLDSAHDWDHQALGALDRTLKQEAADCQSQDKLLTQWLAGQIPGSDGRVLVPDALVTILLPRTRGVRDHKIALSLWTRIAEWKLWGRSTGRIQSFDDRCVWFFVRETITTEPGEADTPAPIHYHALLRFPNRPMRNERIAGRPFTREERCQAMQGALIEASRITPEHCTSRGVLGADIDVKAIENIDLRPARYLFKQWNPRYHRHWDERPVDQLMRDSGLFILPHLPRTKEPTKCRTTHHAKSPDTSDSVAR
jgi:hypothetical protein